LLCEFGTKSVLTMPINIRIGTKTDLVTAQGANRMYWE
jgi:hypothetical protein